MKVEIEVELLLDVIDYLGDGFEYDECMFDKPNVCFSCMAQFSEGNHINDPNFLKHKDKCSFLKMKNKLLDLVTESNTRK